MGISLLRGAALCSAGRRRDIVDKREISKSRMAFLKDQVSAWQQENLIGEETGNAILERYSVKGLNFVRVVLAIGALLVGLGILSFIASNWDAMGKLLKFVIIIGLYIAVNGTGYMLAEKYPKTGKSLIYLGVLVYGAGIFLVGQIFNLGGDFRSAFLLWGAGILPMAWVHRDTVIYIFAQIVLLIFVFSSFEPGGWNPWIFLMIPVLYALNTQMADSAPGTFFNNLLLFAGVGYVLNRLDADGLVVAAVYLVLGALMYVVRMPYNQDIFKFEGAVTFGIAGLFMTGKDIWSQYLMFGNGITASIVFSVLFVLLLLAYVRQGSLIALVFVCATILRFYFDTFFDFMPKSFFFIIGGLILLGFGFYFEQLRSRKGGILNER